LVEIWTELAGRAAAFMGAWAEAKDAPPRLGLSIDDAAPNTISQRARADLDGLTDALARRASAARLLCGTERRGKDRASAAAFSGLLLEIELARS
jgi:hypothetical protein